MFHRQVDTIITGKRKTVTMSAILKELRDDFWGAWGRWQDRRPLWLMGGGIALFLEIFSWAFFQTFLGLLPCELCVYIRFSMLGIFAGAMVGALRPGLHNRVAHYAVHKRRVDFAAAEVPNPHQSTRVARRSRQTPPRSGQPLFYVAPFHTLSCAASRPVENAICKLYPPVSASRSSTSPANHNPFATRECIVSGSTSSSATPPAVTTACSHGP